MQIGYRDDHIQARIDKCVNFAEAWYRNRALSNIEIAKEFRLERLKIENYLTPRFDRDIVEQAMDKFEKNVRDSM